MGKGVLYGVGVGPGDPGLMTLKAIETINKCPVVAAPRTRGGGMVALDIAKGAMDLNGKIVLPLDFAMHRDAGVRAASHRVAADALRAHLDKGESVAMLNLGDITIYASFRYIADILGAEGYAIEMIPGVPSFCAAAATLGTSLTDMELPIRIIPDGNGFPESLHERGTTVWMKSGSNLPALLRRLDEAGLGEKAMLVQNCGMPNQRVYPSLADAEIDNGYFTLVIVKNGAGEKE